MIVLVTGDRNWKDYGIIYRELSKYPPGTVVFHGAARGADSLADIAADKLGFETVPISAEWRIYGKGAGPIRNQKLLQRFLDHKDGQKKVLAFHKNLAESRGTKDMVERARKARLDVFIIDR